MGRLLNEVEDLLREGLVGLGPCGIGFVGHGGGGMWRSLFGRCERLESSKGLGSLLGSPACGFLERSARKLQSITFAHTLLCSPVPEVDVVVGWLLLECAHLELFFEVGVEDVPRSWHTSA